VIEFGNFSLLAIAVSRVFAENGSWICFTSITLLPNVAKLKALATIGADGSSFQPVISEKALAMGPSLTQRRDARPFRLKISTFNGKYRVGQLPTVAFCPSTK
jgi:hypothetical protein